MLNEIQNTELNMAIYFRDFCENNNLNFFLDSGTLLGAVRHKGFIPWDDDMDLILFRKDYEALKKIANKFENDKYKLLFIENTSDYYYPYIKMVDKKTKVIEKNKKEISEMGIFIDIFPMDYVPNNSFIQKIYFLGTSFFRKLFFIFYREKSNSSNPLKRVLFSLFPTAFTRRWAILFEKYGAIFSNKKNAKECSHILGNLKNAAEPVYYFKQSVSMPFENTEFPVPVEYDRYLKETFGDYWQLPPESERKMHGLNVEKR